MRVRHDTALGDRITHRRTKHSGKQQEIGREPTYTTVILVLLRCDLVYGCSLFLLASIPSKRKLLHGIESDRETNDFSCLNDGLISPK